MEMEQENIVYIGKLNNGERRYFAYIEKGSEDNHLLYDIKIGGMEEVAKKISKLSGAMLRSFEEISFVPLDILEKFRIFGWKYIPLKNQEFEYFKSLHNSNLSYAP